MKPSWISILAASAVPMGSGSRYLLSGITSSFTQSEPVASLPNFAVNRASSAFELPAVLGKMLR